MRTYAIGDIHGCYTALATLKDYVKWTPDDTLIMLGDYVDRGPDSYGVIEWLIDRCRKGNTICLRGNHEVMMLWARDDRRSMVGWLQCGGDAALASYAVAGRGTGVTAVPESHWDFLEHTCVDWHETETHLFVHANAYSELALCEQPDSMLFWEHIGEQGPAAHSSGKMLVCGHTSQKSGLPRVFPHAVCIDTWAFGRGWLTCMDVETNRYWQANENGETRSGFLDELLEDR